MELEVFFYLPPPPRGKNTKKNGLFFPKTLLFTTKKFFLQKTFLVVKNRVWGNNDTLDPPPTVLRYPHEKLPSPPHERITLSLKPSQKYQRA